MGAVTETATASWRCFHCDEVFTDRDAAAEHFGTGNYEGELPVCIEAATTELRTLVRTNREMWEEIQALRDEIENLESRVETFEYVARKLTKKADASFSDLENEWEVMEGRVFAAEARARGEL